MKLGLGLRIGRRAQSSAPAYNGPLDSVQSGCLFAVAFGVRLFGSFDPDFEIRRSSDSAVQTFKATTGLDPAASAFVGAGSGFYKSVQDQIGGIVLSQSTETNQPQGIATGGAQQAFGTSFGASSSNDSLVGLTSLAAIPQPFTVFCRMNNVTAALNQGFIRTPGAWCYISSSNWAVRYNGGSVVLSGSASAAGTKTIRYVFDGASSHVAINNGAPSVFDLLTTADASAGAPSVMIGAASLTGTYAFIGIWSGRQDDGTIEAAIDALW